MPNRGLGKPVLGSKPFIISGVAASSSAVGLQQVYLDRVDNLRLGEAGPPLVPQALFEGSAALVRIAGLQFCSAASAGGPTGLAPCRVRRSRPAKSA